MAGALISARTGMRAFIFRTAAIVALSFASMIGSPDVAHAQGTTASGAQSSYFRLDWCDAAEPDQRREGWHFYCDEMPELDEEKEPEVVSSPPAPASAEAGESKQATAVERLAAIRAAVEEARAEAILHPDDPEKLRAYMQAQAQVVEQASTFSDTWRRVVWSDPDLDYTLRRPTNSVAGPVFQQQRNEAERRVLKDLAETYGLFFIFEGPATCSTCAAQAAVLESIVQQYGIGVLGISRDGATLPQFPAPIPGGERLRALGLDETPVPALVLVEPKTDRVVPVSFAAIAEDQVLERIFVITQSKPGDLY